MTKIKQSLVQLEWWIKDEILEQSEKLLADGKLKDLKTFEKNLWTCTVTDEKALEVEVQVKGKNVVAYSCDCGEYNAEEVCIHLGAVLLRLRNIFRKKERTTQSPSAQKRTAKRLTINNLLKEVPAVDLQAFVKDYAKSNKEFNLALKARFVSAVSNMDSEDKYRQLLTSTLKSIKRYPQGIKLQGIKEYAKVIAELQDQIFDAIQLKDYREAFLMIKAIFTQTPEVLRATDKDKSLLLESLEKNLHYLAEMQLQTLAPGLRSTIWDFMLSLVDQAYLVTYHFDLQIFQFLKNNFTSNTKKRLLIAVVEKRLQDDNLSAENQLFFLVNQLDLFNASGQKEKVAQMLKQHLDKPQVLQKAIELAADRADHGQVIKLAKTGLSQDISSSQREQLEEIMFDQHLVLKRKSGIIKWGKKRFLTSLGKKYWSAIKHNSGQKWEQHRREMLDSLSKMPFTIDRRNAQAWALAEEKTYDELFNYLREMGSLELLIQYDHKMPASFVPAIRELYENLLGKYLSQHIGGPASVKVTKILDHLQRHHQTEFVRFLVGQLRQNYPERQALLKALSDY